MKAMIAGAGLAGLTAGYKLKQAGWQVTILEVGSYAGGRAATVQERGYSIDTAATQITSGYKEYIKLCNELGIGGEIFESSQLAGIVRGGRIYELDGSSMFSGPLSSIIGLGSKFKLLNAIIDKLRLKPKLDFLNMSDCYENDTESVRDYARRRLNTEIYDYLAAPLLRGNFLRDPGKVSKLEWFAILDNFSGQKMLSVHGGIGRLPGLLAGDLDVRLGAPVQRVEQIGGKVSVTWSEQGEARTELADACVIATRLPEAMAISPHYAKIAGPLGDKMRYSRGLLVHLGFRKATRSKVIGVMISPNENAQIALVWMEHNKSPECAPPGHSLITCYFDDANSDDFYNMDDEKITEIAQAYLEKLFPELQGQCDLSKVSRWPFAIPYGEPGVYRAIHELKSQLTPADRIQYAADYFTCVGQNSAIYYGRCAAENLLRQSMAPLTPAYQAVV
jgi:oxygen-dependent protoporphyrinogen oxidase